MSHPEPELLLSAKGLWKAYASPVLSGVDFTLRRGEVHALVGENGAGKSTLARILSGLTVADRGECLLHGQPYSPPSRHAAERLGVRMVMQELNLAGTLSVAENIFLERMPQRWGWIDYRRLNAEATQWLTEVGLGQVSAEDEVQRLGIGQQQLVEIAAGLSQKCEVLILDEPTAALTEPEVARLFAQIRRLQARGTGIIYISHRLEELQTIANRITVLRDGRMIATHNAADVELNAVVQDMVGRPVGEGLKRQERPIKKEALRVEGLRRNTKVRDVSFTAYGGEILGFAGLMGAGRTETMRLIFGADPKDQGRIFLHGDMEPTAISSPCEAVRHGIALLTEDRKEQGLLLPLSIASNLSLATMDRVSLAHFWISAAAERAASETWCQKLRVRCQSPAQPVAELSGGNQQKVVIGKWLWRDCDILIFDEPTRGIDVGARQEIHQLLLDLTRTGKTVLVVSSDLKELLDLCDRLVVMSNGKVAGTFERGTWSQDAIMKAALSEYC